MLKLKQQRRQSQIASIAFLILWSIFRKIPDCLFFWHPKVAFQNKRLFSATSESRFSFESWIVYLKMRADSKRDGIKREHVIFTQACLRSRQRMITSSRSNLELWGEGGGGRFEKLCVPLVKSLLSPCPRYYNVSQCKIIILASIFGQTFTGVIYQWVLLFQTLKRTLDQARFLNYTVL